VAGRLKEKTMQISYDVLDSPIGPLTLAERDGALCLLDFGDPSHGAHIGDRLRRRYGAVELQRERDLGGFGDRLRAYLGGALDALDAIPVDPGGTAFQSRVWRALREIPAGETRSYAWLAKAVGRPSSARAVGRANGSNPIAIVLPCHRVVGSDGSLTGYAGGIESKRFLLEHEGAL
jgi:methylated-DNA-[protein]-cysteine S-methyltransferase